MAMWISAQLRCTFRETEGSEIVEFAVPLPLLIVLVVAIYDFGAAFTVKHMLSNTVREGARIASSQHHPPNPTGTQNRDSDSPSPLFNYHLSICSSYSH